MLGLQLQPYFAQHNNPWAAQAKHDERDSVSGRSELKLAIVFIAPTLTRPGLVTLAPIGKV